MRKGRKRFPSAQVKGRFSQFRVWKITRVDLESIAIQKNGVDGVLNTSSHATIAPLMMNMQIELKIKNDP
jgi:hypothetical protein